jgi:hypothetical protein
MVFQKEADRERKIRELVNYALEERSEVYRERVLRVIMRAEIDPDDPLFLVILALGSVEVMLHELPATLERREAKLNHLVEALEAQYERFRVAADDVTTVIHDSESRIKKLITLKLPGDGNRIQSIAKIAGLGAIAFALGILLSQPIIRLSSSVLCHTTSTCEEGEKVK